MERIQKLKNLITKYYEGDDPAHDWNHVERVVKNAIKISKQENIQSELILAAVYCHDLINLPKNHPERSKASERSALEAIPYLKEVGFSEDEINEIQIGIIQHSFSRNEKPSTIIASIVQDADRLDALGAIGILRCAITAGKLNSSLYDLVDPLAKNRDLNDQKFMIDHYFKKLFLLPDLMYTKSAKEMAETRVEFMKSFLKNLLEEI